MESFSASAHKNDTNTKFIINAAETMISTDRCGPRFCKLKKIIVESENLYKIARHKKLTFKNDRTLSQVFIFRSLLKRKSGTSDFLARLDDVKCENSFAYNNLH